MISLQILLVLFLVGLSLFLATVEAAFNLAKRRRLTQVGFHDEARVSPGPALRRRPAAAADARAGRDLHRPRRHDRRHHLDGVPRAGALGDARGLRRDGGLPAALPRQPALHPGAPGSREGVPEPAPGLPPVGRGARAAGRQAAPPRRAGAGRGRGRVSRSRAAAAAGAAAATRSGWWTRSTASRRRSCAR